MFSGFIGKGVWIPDLGPTWILCSTPLGGKPHFGFGLCSVVLVDFVEPSDFVYSVGAVGFELCVEEHVFEAM